MYMSLKSGINNCMNISEENPAGNIFVFPQVDRGKAEKVDSWHELQVLIRELENLTAERLPSGYYKILRHKKKITDPKIKFSGTLKLGDDRTDALAMSNYGLDYMQSKNSTRFYKADYVRGF